MPRHVVNIVLAVACVAASVAVNRRPARRVGAASASILLPRLPRPDETLLSRPVAALDFTDAPIEAVALKLGEIAGAPVWIDRDVSGDPKTTPNPVVTVHVKDTTVSGALLAIIASLHAQGYHDLDFDAMDGGIRVTSAAVVGRRFESECFNVRSLAAGLEAKAPWLVARQPESSRYHGESAFEQIIRLVTTNVAPATWQDIGGSYGNITNVGGVLVVTQSPKNLGIVRRLLAALDRVSRGDPPTLTLHPGPTRPPMRPTGITLVNIAALLEKLRPPAAGDSTTAGQTLDVLDNIQDLVRFAIASTTGQVFSVWIHNPHACGSVVIFSATTEHEQTVHRLLKALDQAADAPAFSPVIVEGDQAPTLSLPTMRIACFNVKSLMLALGRDGSAMPASEQLQIYVVDHVKGASWVLVNGGDLYLAGDVLVVVQTPENIKSIQGALEQLAGEVEKHAVR
jgi:hypothetical protein